MKNIYCIEYVIVNGGKGEIWKVNLVDTDGYYQDFLYILDYVEKDSDLKYWIILESENIEKALMLGILQIRTRIQDCEG
jgi:hypothetical protein